MRILKSIGKFIKDIYLILVKFIFDIINSLKAFFSPIDEGHFKGLTFSKWFWGSFQRFGLIGVFLTFIFIVAINKSEFYHEPYWYPILLSFLSGILLLIIFKILQHWDDLKNGRSR